MSTDPPDATRNGSRSFSGRLRQAVWGPTSTRIRHSAHLREPAIKAYRAVARLVLTGPPPKVLANSIPKSGTHLLTQLLGETPRLWYSGVHIVGEQFRADGERSGDRAGPFDRTAFGAKLAPIRNGQYVTAHLPAEDGAGSELERLEFRHLLIVRDPRDIVVSRAFYLASETKLYAHARFAALDGNAERVMAAIRGLPATGTERAVTSMGERLDRYRPWLADPSVCVVRFEDLVGPHGGGTEAAQFEAIRRVLSACNRPADDATIRTIAGRVYSKHSATFRRGAIGDWRNHLDDAHLAAFEEVAPGALAAYGYE